MLICIKEKVGTIKDFSLLDCFDGWTERAYIGMLNYVGVGYQKLAYDVKNSSCEDLMQHCVELWNTDQVRGESINALPPAMTVSADSVKTSGGAATAGVVEHWDRRSVFGVER